MEWNRLRPRVCVCVITKSLKNRLRTVQLLFRETLYPRLSLYPCFSRIYTLPQRAVVDYFWGRFHLLEYFSSAAIRRLFSLARSLLRASCLVTFAMKIDRFVSIFVSVPFSRHTTRRSVENTKTYYGGNIRECVCKCANV